MWPSPTSILYAEKDNLTSRQEVDDFIRCFPCDLTVLKGGEHWFHTPEQLEILRQWTDTQTAGEQPITEVVAALIWDGDKFMVCQRPAHKARGLLWEFVGGKVERGETKEQALIRECREELAVTVAVGEVFMEVTHTYPDLTVHLTLFHAIIAEGTSQNWSTMTSAGSQRMRSTTISFARQMRRYWTACAARVNKGLYELFRF